MEDRYIELTRLERELVLFNRQRFASCYAILPGTMSLDESAVAGLDGWLFVSRGANGWEQQFSGEIVITDCGIEQWRDAFARRKKAANSIGASFCHIAIPEKQCVFPQFRNPAHTPGGDVGNSRPIDRIIEVAGDSLVYPLRRMIDESWRSELYFRGDSHWTVSGAWLTFCELAKSIWPEKIFPIENLPLIRLCRRHDLLLKYVAEPIYEEVVGIPRNAEVVFDNQLWAKTGRHVGNKFVLRNNSAMYREAVAVYGDSYSWDYGFSDLLSSYFKEIHFFWDSEIDFDYCRENNVKNIVVQSAERNLLAPHVNDRGV